MTGNATAAENANALCACGHETELHQPDYGGCRACYATTAADEPCDCVIFRTADVRFGGGDEDGLLCGCQRRVSTPFCPWCGRRLDDAPAQLITYLEAAAYSAEKSAATREAQGDRYPGERRERTAARLRASAAQRREWAAWVAGARDALRTFVALDGKDRPPEEWDAVMNAARKLIDGARTAENG